jgi:adenylate cyclase
MPIRLRLFLAHLMTVVTRRLRNSFYLYLALLLTCGVLLDAGVFHIGENMKQKAFDFMVRHRVLAPKPDADIVIVDVNEASLSALAPDFGRWPWPRQVFGEFLENLEAQKPKAVVFDILFADADIYNPDSDTYFNDTVAGFENVYFPFLRLAEEHDKLSLVKPAMIPGVTPLGPQANQDATIAIVLPHFKAALKAGRLGTHNIYPDTDGIVRDYRLYRDDYGWKLPSLPLTIGLGLGYKTPEGENALINWRGGPFTYHYVSFSDVYRDMSGKAKHRSQNEFAGKIVIIGSTAPSLFDLKATAMNKFHPGVEILATAIDNVKHNDYLRFWRGPWFYVLMSLLLIWITAWMFFRNVGRERFDKVFGFSQMGLLAVSYVGINLTNTYIDLTGPVTWAVACFSIARMYAMADERAMQHWLAHGIMPGRSGMHVLLMPVLLESAEPLGDAIMGKLHRTASAAGSLQKNVDIIKGTQSGVWGLFGDMLAITWEINDTDSGALAQARNDADAVAGQLETLVRRFNLPQAVRIQSTQVEDVIDSAYPMAPQWRILLAKAILKLEHMDQMQPTSGNTHHEI